MAIPQPNPDPQQLQRAIRAVRKLAMKVESSARMKRAVAKAIKSMGLPDPKPQ